MDAFVKLVLGMEGLIFLAVVVTIVVLIVRRVKIKKTEDFEKRDN